MLFGVTRTEVLCTYIATQQQENQTGAMEIRVLRTVGEYRTDRVRN